MTLRHATNPARWADGSPRSQCNAFTLGYTDQPIDWSGFNLTAAMRERSTRTVERRRVLEGRDFTTPVGMAVRPVETIGPAITSAMPLSMTERLRAALATGPKSGDELAELLGVNIGAIGPLLKYDIKQQRVVRTGSPFAFSYALAGQT